MMAVPCRQRAVGHIVSVAHPAAPQAGETLHTPACDEHYRAFERRHPGEYEWRPLPEG